MPKLPDTDRLPSIEELQVSTKGIQKLLADINPKKASGPDEVPCRNMKEAAQEIAHFLRDLYQQGSYQKTGNQQTSPASSKRVTGQDLKTTDQCHSHQSHASSLNMSSFTTL